MKRIIFVCLLISSLGAMNARAQSLSISGTVTDDAGAIPQATVTLKVSGQILVRETAADGKYSFDSLTSGVYNISIVKPGFEAKEDLITLNKENQTYDARLAVGAVSTTIVVTDVAGKATASRLPILNEEIPAQVSTISTETLQTQSVNDLATALRNVSGASAQRFYGVYEYYTLRGFNQADVQAVDGMRMEGNRINTQLNNVEQVEVLKGPASVLYGGGALSGVINIIRKKPQGTRAYDFFYRGGRWNLQNFGGGATGAIIENKLLFRVDGSYEHNNGWRGAGARRFNISPSLTWLINNRNRVTVHESINRDDFDGDGGLPLDVVNMPGFDLSRRYSTPYDFEHFRDSQTHVLFNSTLSSNWEFRDGFFKRWTNDRYFITEGVGYLPDTNEIDRYALFFEHHRRPIMNQADVVGRFSLLGMRHTLLFGHEYQDFYNITDRTADGGDIFPGSINATNPVETFKGPDLTVLEQDHASNRIQAGFWQDQINVTEHLSLNIAGRYDDYRRSLHIDLRDTGNSPYVRGTDTVLNQSAYTFRAGAVYSLPHTQQIYFNSANAFQPVTAIPANGTQLKPETGITYEAGHRWQALNGRFKTNIAFYKLERNNVTINLGQRRYTQAGQQSSKGVDIDITGSLGKGFDVVANYGYTLPRFDNYIEGGQNLSGLTPRYTQRHAANLWLSKSWTSGLRISAGMRYLGPQFTNNNDTIRLGGYTTFSGAAGYRIRNWDISVNAENLLNRQRYFQGSDYDNQVYPGSPINVFTTIRYRFH